jgi:HD-like signal output (HDOD) protein
MLIKSRKKNQADQGGSVLREALGDVDIPSFPGVILDTLETLRDPEVSAHAVAESLRPDPGATVRLLRLVNSAAYGPAQPVRSVSQAVAIAGLGTAESMLLAVGVKVALPNVDVDGLDQRRFWQAAARRGALAKAFAEQLHPATAGESFTAGLLQDMAVPLLAIARPEYRPVLREWHGEGGDLAVMEEATFGWSHDSVAAELCNAWELPINLQNAIGGHHGHLDFVAPPAVTLSAPLREVRSQEALEEVIILATENYGMNPDATLELVLSAEDDAAEIAQLFT